MCCLCVMAYHSATNGNLDACDDMDQPKGNCGNLNKPDTGKVITATSDTHERSQDMVTTCRGEDVEGKMQRSEMYYRFQRSIYHEEEQLCCDGMTEIYGDEVNVHTAQRVSGEQGDSKPGKPERSALMIFGLFSK